MRNKTKTMKWKDVGEEEEERRRRQGNDFKLRKNTKEILFYFEEAHTNTRHIKRINNSDK